MNREPHQTWCGARGVRAAHMPSPHTVAFVSALLFAWCAGADTREAAEDNAIEGVVLFAVGPDVAKALKSAASVRRVAAPPTTRVTLFTDATGAAAARRSAARAAVDEITNIFGESGAFDAIPYHPLAPQHKSFQPTQDGRWCVGAHCLRRTSPLRVGHARSPNGKINCVDARR